MTKITKANTCPLGLYRIKDLPVGEYVRRVDRCKGCAGSGHTCTVAAGVCQCEACEGKGYTNVHAKTYIRERYDAFNGGYPLSDVDDTNRQLYQRGSVVVLAGFTY